jgi:glycosyltransferase involved in cell wall biosynthesis
MTDLGKYSDGPKILFGVTSEASLLLLAPVVRHFTDRGWQVHVACEPVAPDWPTAHRWNLKCKTHAVQSSRRMSPFRDARGLMEWIGLLRDVQPEVVVGATPKAGVLSMVASRAVGTPVRIMHLWGARWDRRSGLAASAVRRAEWLAARAATDVVAVSESLADLYLSSGVVGQRPVVIGSGGSKGVDLDRFRPVPRTPGPLTLGYVGRLTPDKGIGDALECLRRVREVVPDARLFLAGSSDPMDPIEEGVVRQLHSPGVVPGMNSYQVETVIQQLDVLVFPSRREGLPNAVIEASACGVPAVGYPVTGVRDAIRDGVNGRLVSFGDVPALAQAALEVAGWGPEAVDRIRGFAAANFSQEQVIGGFREFVSSRLDVAGAAR